MYNEAYINQLIVQMEDLGYFKYADPADLDELKEDLWFGFKTQCLNPTLDEVLMSTGKELRYYMIDHLSVMDRDFIPYFLEEIEAVLSQMGIEISDLEIPRSRNYKNRIADIIDAVNKIIITDPETSDRFYLVNKDDELGCYLLTPALQIIFETHIEDKNDHPLQSDEWLDFHF